VSEAATSPNGLGGSIKDMASILENFVPKSEYGTLYEQYNELKGQHDKVLKQYEGVDLKKLNGRLQELEGKVRTHNFQSAYKGLVDELRINPEFADEVFELAKLTMDKDEPDLKQMKSVLKDFLELKPKFRLEQTEEGQGQQQPKNEQETIVDSTAPVAKPKLHTSETGRGGKAIPPGRFAYTSENLRSHEWMARNAVAYSRAIQDGTAYKVG
jgi:hypothetical protein